MSVPQSLELFSHALPPGVFPCGICCACAVTSGAPLRQGRKGSTLLQKTLHITALSLYSEAPGAPAGRPHRPRGQGWGEERRCCATGLPPGERQTVALTEQASLKFTVRTRCLQPGVASPFPVLVCPPFTW